MLHVRPDLFLTCNFPTTGTGILLFGGVSRDGHRLEPGIVVIDDLLNRLVERLEAAKVEPQSVLFPGHVLAKDPRRRLLEQAPLGHALALIQPLLLRLGEGLDDGVLAGVGAGLLRPGDQTRDHVDVGLDGRGQVRERALGARDHEQVGEVGHRHAQVGRGAVGGPVVLEGEAAAAPDADAVVVALDGVEAGGEDDDVEVVGPRGRLDARGGDARDGRLLQLDHVDVREVEPLKVAAVAEGPAGVVVVGLQLARLLRVPDDLPDLLADEGARGLVGGPVGGDVAEAVEHELEAVALLPQPLEDGLALLGRRDRVERNRRLDEPEPHDRVLDLLEDLVVPLVDALAVARLDGPVATGHRVLGVALEGDQGRHLGRDVRDHLDARRAAPDDAHALARQVEVPRPRRRVALDPLERVETRDVGVVGLGE